MKIEQFRQRAGVTEKYVPGAGATPLLRNSRVGYAALVAPAPALTKANSALNQVPDSALICAGFGPELVLDLTRSKYLTYPCLTRTGPESGT